MDVGEDYVIGSSFRRGAEVREFKKRVPDPIIVAINRWKNIERGEMMRPRFSMLEHYSNVVLIL